jgi:hypothetical protein
MSLFFALGIKLLTIFKTNKNMTPSAQTPSHSSHQEKENDTVKSFSVWYQTNI